MVLKRPQLRKPAPARQVHIRAKKQLKGRRRWGCDGAADRIDR